MRNVHCRDFFAWWLSFCFAGVALMVPAQSQSPGQNLNSNAPVAIPPDALAHPQPGVKPQPSGSHWADNFRIQKVSNDDDWTRHFRIGAMVGMNINASFSMNGTFPVNQVAGVYGDGHVIPIPSDTQDNLTWNWGYDHSSQIVGSQLQMHSVTSFTTSGSSEQSGSVFPGFDMAYGGNLFYLGRARIGWDLGFGFLPISITDSRPMSVTSVNQNTSAFGISAINMLGEPPGYQGGPSGPSIPSDPLSVTPSTPVTPGPGQTWTVTGSRELDVMLYTVRLGPSVYWDLNEHFGLSASAGPAMGIVSGDYKYNEIVSAGGISANSQGQIGATDLVYGGYVNATIMYHVPNESADIYLGAQYMPMEDATFSNGNRESRLKLGGQVYISAGINWAF